MAVRIVNAGDVAGVETAQVYLRFPAAAQEPDLLLKAFGKTPPLEAGANATLPFALDLAQHLSVWQGRVDDETGRWELVRGAYDVRVGASSQDVRQTASFEVGR